MDAQRKAIFQMLVCAALWSIAGAVMKWVDCHAMAIACIRGAFAALTIFTYMRIKRERLVLTRNTLLNAAFLGLTCTSFVLANKMTTAANAVVLQFTSPVFVMLGSAIFYKQRFRPFDICAVVCTLGGMVLFFLDDLDAGHLIGNLIAIASGLLLAGMFLTVNHAGERERMSGLFLGQLLSALIGLPFLFFTQNSFTPQNIGLLALLGVFQLGVPYILLGLASGHCPPLACSLISAVEPLLNPVWVALFVGELPGPWALAGAAVVVGSVTGWCILKDRTAGENVRA